MEERRGNLKFNPDRSDFLFRAGILFSSSLNRRQTIANLARLAIPSVADWGIIDICLEESSPSCFLIIHPDPQKKILSQKLQENRRSPLAAVDSAKLFANPKDEDLLQVIRNPEDLPIIKALGARSVIAVPVVSRGHRFGVIALFSGNQELTGSKFILTRKLAHRTALALENSQIFDNLRRAATRQKTLDRRKDQFVAMTSHELKSPLSSALAYSQLLEKRLSLRRDSTSLLYLARTREQLDRLSLLTEDLLDVTKIRVGKLELKKEILNFDEIISTAVELSRFTAADHKIILEENASVKVAGDRNRLGQVLGNYLANAVKYSPGKKKVIVSAKINGPEVVASVRDFGIGISLKDRARIFDLFYQAATPQASSRGLGLGLYICGQIIKLHDGRVWVESKKGQGSTFFFSLPVIS